MKKVLFGLLIVVLAFSGLSCLANEVKDYAELQNFSPEIVETLVPLGKDGMDENEKGLIDEISILPQEGQVSETALNLLSEFAQDRVVTSEEFDRLKDLDQDGLSNQEELKRGTDLLNPDSDNDGLKDGEETLTYGTNPLELDSDNDGLNDGDEVLVYGTNPLKEDSDDDTLNDYEEVVVHKSDPLNKDNPLIRVSEDSSGDFDKDVVINSEDPEPLKENDYKETVSWLSKEMKEDALSCIDKTDKVQTFKNLCDKVYENVPHAKHSRGQNEYPNAEWDALDDYKYPRDLLMCYYSYHQEVQLPPDCDDIACVYDIMADYIIEQTGWDDEGEKQGTNGVDCDMFGCQFNGSLHALCIININGVEYVADPVYYERFFILGQDSRYKFPWDEGWHSDWFYGPTETLMVKFDKRYMDTVYIWKYPRIWLSMDKNSLLWELMRNQTPENEKGLEELYLEVISAN